MIRLVIDAAMLFVWGWMCGMFLLFIGHAVNYYAFMSGVGATNRPIFVSITIAFFFFSVFFGKTILRNASKSVAAVSEKYLMPLLERPDK